MNTDQFQELVINNFQDINKSLNDTCSRVSRLEQKVEDYVDHKVKNSERKYQFITVVMAGITTISAVWALFK